ncbi:MAG: beta-galactosidase [Aristaeellaceae bacterium]
MEKHTLSFTPSRVASEPVAIGATASGDVIGATAHHLLRDGRPWYPVMGEFHYSRYPAAEWPIELRKMKALGVQIVATYVFWIHHEEERGVWRTDGSLDLRRFLLDCRDAGLEVLLRIGPWAHGECRNGGFPDWLQHDAAIRPRTDDPRYLALVKGLFANIFRSAEGLMYRDGGPIIGIQLENEYGHCGGESGGSGLVHMMTLKRLAVEAGFRVPIYTATGWGGGNVVDGEMLPVMGGYADAPWDHSLTPLPASPNFLLQHAPNDPLIASDWQHSGERFTYRVADWPYLTAELGGGVQCTFHRRPLISARDTSAQALCKLATGANLLGYYMFHGGTNPMGRHSTLQESTATGSWTDVPVRSYDFQAPLGEAGALHESAYELKALHMLVADRGESLAGSLCHYPADQVTDAENLADLRWCVRFNADTREGFLFINNHQRLRVMADHRDVAFTILAGDTTFALPPMDIPGGFCGVIPFNLRVGGRRLLITNAQLLCTVQGIPVLYTRPGQEPVLQWDGPAPEVILLTAEQALHAWRAGDRLILSEACILPDGDGLLALSDRPEVTAEILPGHGKLIARTEEVRVSAGLEEVSRGEDCAVYHVTLGDVPADKVDDVLLDLDFTGDHADVYLDGELIADWYTTGQPWRLALKRHGYPRALEVRVYPVTRPTYFEIPVPQGMTLDRASAHARYLLPLTARA